MKSFNNLYQEICSLENLYRAEAKARKLKTRKGYVEDFRLHREEHLRQLHDELTAGVWKPSIYRHFRIHDPKERLISAAPFRDRVVHHALCSVIGPLIERRFVRDSYSCQLGKGTLAARDRCREYTNKFKYVLKCDVKKFFQSIDQEVLIAKLARVIRCKRTLALCRLIIDSYQDGEVMPACFPGDDLFDLAHGKRGLPIGNLTSQLWANLYLDRLDHYIKETLLAPGYARYTDDWLIWSDSKGFLQQSLQDISKELWQERLCLHPGKTQILRTANGVPFVGFRFLPGRAPRIAGSGKRRFERRTRRQIRDQAKGRADASTVESSVFGWAQYARYANSEGLFKTYAQQGFGMNRRMSVGRVLRGASWNNNESRNLLSSNRNNNNPDNRNNNNGFRVVLVP